MCQPIRDKYYFRSTNQKLVLLSIIQSEASIYLSPDSLCSIPPVVFIIVMGDGVDCYLVTSPPQLLHHAVVVVSVTHEEGCLDVASVRILEITVEELVNLFIVVCVDCVIKCYHDHLRNLL